MQFKRTWKQVDGVLLLDKPLGMTSNDALQKVRRLFSAAKGGHTGTLDPLATGLLPLCFGEATKFSADLLDADKTYEAVVKLGVTTDSGDAEGQVIANATVDVKAKAQIWASCRFHRRHPADSAHAFGAQARWPAALRTGPPRVSKSSVSPGR
jgi:tRNA pseudouridine55 synthase